MAGIGKWPEPKIYHRWTYTKFEGLYFSKKATVSETITTCTRTFSTPISDKIVV